MSHELTIYIDNYPAISYEHDYYHELIKNWKEKNNIPKDEKILTKEDIISLRQYLFEYYINPQEARFDYDLEGERILGFIKDITVMLQTFPSTPQYKILLS